MKAGARHAKSLRLHGKTSQTQELLMHTVVYTFDGFDMVPEKKVLSAIDVEMIPSHGVDSPESRAILAKADAIMIALEKITPEVMDAMPKCKLISRFGVGVDNIDIAAATQRGIQVTNVPDYGVDEVATHAASLMLTLLRGIPQLVNNTRAGKWDSAVARPIRRFSEQTVGVMGFGRIGRAFATKAKGFGVRILAYDPLIDAATIRSHGAEPVDMEALFRESDFISLHLPLTDETRHVVNAKSLATMKPSAYIINTARGGLVDEAALLAAVRSGQIRGAALDVLSIEPPPKDHPVLSELLKEERILVTPHFAWYSEEAMIDMRSRGAEEVVRALSGQPPRSPVNKI
jgi:D-3-phosphoglycerate dehydrogenase